MSAGGTSSERRDDSSRRYDLIVIGVSCTEEIIRVPKLPPLDSHREVDVLGRWHSVGGNGLNVALHAARLGADVALISKIPQSIAADVNAALDAAGVDRAFLVHAPGQEAPSVLLVTDAQGEYAVFVSDRSGLAFTPEDVAPHSSLNAAYVHIDGFTLGALGSESQLQAAQQWITIAQRSPAALSIDLNRAICDAQPQRAREIVSQAEVLFANAYEGAAITGTASAHSAARSLVDAGVPAVVVKDGAAGLVCAAPQILSIVPAFDSPLVTSFADTVGAGDGVVAGTLYGLSRGLPLVEAAQHGAAVAALVCTGHGSQGAAIDAADVARLLQGAQK